MSRLQHVRGGIGKNQLLHAKQVAAHYFFIIRQLPAEYFLLLQIGAGVQRKF
jgi:hypothetical protein